MLWFFVGAWCAASPFFGNAFRDRFPIVPLAAPWQSVGQIGEHLRAQDARSVDDFVRVLDPQLRRRPVPMPFTRSDQKASFEEPRIILYHPSGDFYVAYDAHGTSVDMIHLKGARYEFARVDFASGRPVFANASVTERCYACHAKGARTLEEARVIAHPIFDTYSDWPDAYGNSDRDGSGTAPFSDVMRNGWKLFQANLESNPRYAQLIGLRGADLRTIEKLAGDLQEKIGDSLMRRTARLIAAHPDYERWHRSFWYLQENGESNFVDTLGAHAADYRAYRERERPIVTARIKAYYDSKARRFNRRSGLLGDRQVARVEREYATREKPVGIIDFDSSRVHTKIRLGYLLERMGLSLDLLNVTLEPRTFSHTQADGHLFQIHRFVQTELVTCASEIKR